MIHAHNTMYGGKREPIKYIVIHYTGNNGDTARNNCVYFSREQKYKASAHYFVDELGWEQSVLDNEVAWSVGVLHNRTYATYWGKCTNANSISVEMCNSVTRNDKVEDQTATLVKELMKKYNISKSHVVRHLDVCGKDCPHSLVNNAEWHRFLNKLDELPDTELEAAVSKIIDAGIKINATSWNNKENIRLKNVGALLDKLGGLNKLIENGVIEEVDRWKNGNYTVDSVRWLLIKFAKTL